MIRSIRTRLTVTFIALAVIPLLFTGIALTWQTYKSEKTHASEKVRETARWIGVEVHSFLAEVVSHLDIILQVRGLSGLPYNEQQDILEELLVFHNEFDELSLLNPQGREIIKVHRTTISEHLDLLDQSQSDEFLLPSRTGKFFFSPVFFSQTTAEPYLHVAVPSFDMRDDSLQGILVAKVRLKMMWELISNLQLQPGEDVYIIDSQNRIVAHRNPSIVLRETEISWMISSNGDKQLAQTGLNGRPVIQASHRIPLGNRSMEVIAERETDKALALAYRMLTIFLVITFSVLVIASIFIAMVTGNIVKPIQNLVHTARAIMRGDISSQAQVRQDDEIGELALTFNRMTSQLRHSLDDLHGEVKERTQAEQALQKELQINEAFTSLSSVLLTIYEIDDIAKLVLERAKDLTGSGHGFVSALDPKTGQNICHTLTDMMGDKCIIQGHEKSIIFPALLDGNFTDIPGHILSRHDSFFTNDLPNHPDSKGIPQGHVPVQRYLSVPVILNDELAGQIALANAPQDYSPKDIDVIERLGRLYALAISRYRNRHEREKLTSALRQAQKMEAIGTLAGGIAHDFNNILTPILGYSELIRSSCPQDGEIAEEIEQVISATLRARKLIKQILTFSRDQEQERQNVQLHIIVKEALKLLRASIPTSIEIKHNINEQCGEILADPTQMHQIIMNLCTNAYQAMPDANGSLAVSLQPVTIDDEDLSYKLDLTPGQYIRLEVSDTGKGMTREVIERIFEPYFSTKEEGKGTGLGLSVVHGIVKGHGGDITVYSEPGQGTTFRIYLPCSNTVETTEEEVAPRPLTGGDEHILIVDDEQSIISYEERLLTRLGYQVTSTLDSQQALELFQTQPDSFDLVITDMTMPQLNGIDLAKSILALRPDMPIIICTGYSELINEEKAQELGIKTFIVKPITIHNFSAVVRTVLDEQGLDQG